MKKLLEIKNLRTYFFVEPPARQVNRELLAENVISPGILSANKWMRNRIAAKAVDGVSLDIFEDEIFGLVGESGAGKSVTAYSIIKLIPEPPGFIAGGEIIYKGTDLLNLSIEELRQYRGKEISVIFQEPMTSLNPVMSAGDQISESLIAHYGISYREAKKKAVELMSQTGIPDAHKRYSDYPHTFSGGMRQRIMIAMALACSPSLLIADEPTTSLDVTVQVQILELILESKRKRKESSVLLITHNLGVVYNVCDRIGVMYGGKIQELTSKDELFRQPKHPYTVGLLESHPDSVSSNQKLNTIKGNVPGLLELPDGCRFCTRCSRAVDECFRVEPELKEVTKNHFVRCHLY